MKLTRKQIIEIMNHTPANLKHTHATIEDPLGYFTPSGANWSYRRGRPQYTTSRRITI